MRLSPSLVDTMSDRFGMPMRVSRALCSNAANEARAESLSFTASRTCSSLLSPQ